MKRGPVKSRLSRHCLASLCVLAALTGFSLPAAAGTGSAAPEARASAKCRSVTTLNGGKAKYVNTVNARCKTGRRVAKRANGKRYTFLGFECKPKKSQVPGKLYGCGRVKNGEGQGIGFIYTAP